MSEEWIENLKKAIGREGKPSVIHMESSMVKSFVEAIEDANPLWQNEEYAGKTPYKGTVVPPQMLVTSMMSGGGTRPELPPILFTRVLDGGGEWEFFSSIRVGDTITITTKLKNIRETEGKLGKMLLLFFETTHKNQKGEIVARSQGTQISY